MMPVMMLMLMDLRFRFEFTGESGWVAVRLVFCSPATGIVVESDWHAMPVETRGD